MTVIASAAKQSLAEYAKRIEIASSRKRSSQ